MKTRNRRYLGSSGMDRDKSEELGKTSGDYPTYWQNLGRSVENEIPDRLAIPDTGKQDFRRHDSHENESLKKAISWIGKTRKLHLHHAFFFQLHFFAVTTRFRTFYGERKQVTTKFFSLSELECGCQEFGSKRVRLHLTKNASWNNPDRDWKNANSLFKWRFRRRRLKSQF